MALSLLEQLLPQLDEQERAIFDEIVAADEQYTVYVNLSRQYPADAVSTLRERRQSPDDNYARRGLPWVLALARVEMASLSAGFTDEEEPAMQLRPTRDDESEAYIEVLLDGVRCHSWALKNDPVALKPLAANLPEAKALAYERRASVALELTQELRSFASNEFTADQNTELGQIETSLTNLRETLRTQVLKLGMTKKNGKPVPGKLVPKKP